MRPMLATRGATVPDDPGWLHEVKWDGMRVLGEVSSDGIAFTSRLGNDVSVAFPELRALAGLLPPGTVVDGEVVALVSGLPSFPALAERLHVVRAARAAELARQRPVTLLAFDLPRLAGRDLCGLPLAERRTLLERLVLDGPHWQAPPVYDDGRALLEGTRAQGLEGVVSKRLDSRYEPGVRSPQWLKFPHRDTSSWVIGGWRSQVGTPGRLGAVLVGEPVAGRLLYRGRVGSGFTGQAAVALQEVLAGLERVGSPFDDEVPRVDAAGATWVEPLLVIDVEALGFSTFGRLRQPSFRGFRPDLDPDGLE